MKSLGKRVLVVSQRDIVGKDLIANSVPYEFEDWICDMDAADLIVPQRAPNAFNKAMSRVKPSAPIASETPATASFRSRLKSKLSSNKVTRKAVEVARQLIWSTPLNRWFAPRVNSISLEQDYDLLYIVLTEPWEIFNLRSIPEWRKRCKFAVCHIVEMWSKEIDDLKLIYQEFAEFDKIYSNCFFITDEISTITGRPCEYLPFTVDAIKFCPYPNPPKRFIDVNYIGRRSSITHEALLRLSEKNSFLYFYDTAKDFRTRNHREHRLLLAHLLKRSRYFFANRSKLDDSCSQGRSPEFGWRYFEGAASGAVMLGMAPETEVFKCYFDWPDAVIQLPFDVEDIANVLAELDSQPERLEKIRKVSILNALQRYDWLYIWEKILKEACLSATPQMQERREQLNALAELVASETLDNPVLKENTIAISESVV